MSNIQKQSFGEMEDGQKVDLFTLANSNGMGVSITNYGGIITKIIVPDKDDKMGDVILGYDNLSGYLENNFYFGAIVGRNCNRIAKGNFTLNNSEYSLPINNGKNHLHGGINGFDKVLWTAKEINLKDQYALELTYVSADGEEGYPGTMQVKVTYWLTDSNELWIEYNAITDKPTICNLTNHTYFNLCDAGRSNILNHKIWIDADQITPVDAMQVPTGEFMQVNDTPFDFRKAELIGDRIGKEHEQFDLAVSGFDHNYVLNGKSGDMRRVASVSESSSGRLLEVFTEEPGLQFYSGNYLNDNIIGRGGIVYKQHTGFCLETQHFPDAPNQPDFPSTVLNPGEAYKSATIYKFSVTK